MMRIFGRCLCIVIAALGLGACGPQSTGHTTSVVPPVGGTVTTTALGIVELTPWQWQTDAQTQTLSIPTTAQNPGPTTQIIAHHATGLGTELTGNSITAQVQQQAQAFFTQLTPQMQAKGWQALFNPIATGAYPSTAMYLTFQAGAAYVFVEYSATYLSDSAASDQIDIAYSA